MKEQGRQGGGYTKQRLFEFTVARLSMDCYILRFPEGSEVKPHRDPVPFSQHYRLNLTLRQPVSGGVVWGMAPMPPLTLPKPLGRFHWFRPDEVLHWMTKVHSGEGIMLSLGFAIQDKPEVIDADIQ